MRRPSLFGLIGKQLSLAERYYERGLHYYEKNKLDLALADLDAAVLEAPKNAEFLAARGFILLQSARLDDAEEDFILSLELDPKQWLAHYGRGIHAFDAADYDKAVDCFSRAQLIESKRPEIYFYRAVALHQLGRSDEAIRDMTYAQSLFVTGDKRIEQAKKWLGTFSAEQGKSP